MKIEQEFFDPHIAGTLGDSIEKAQELQVKLEKFGPNLKVVNVNVEMQVASP